MSFFFLSQFLFISHFLNFSIQIFLCSSHSCGLIIVYDSLLVLVVYIYVLIIDVYELILEMMSSDGMG